MLQHCILLNNIRRNEGINLVLIELNVERIILIACELNYCGNAIILK